MSKPKKKQKIYPMLLILFSIIVLLGAVIALVSTQKPDQVNLNNIDSEHEEDYSDIERVTLEEAKKALDLGQAVFLDVRGPAAFDGGHIPGSKLIPVIEIENRLNELNPNDWIITYCT